LINVAVAGYGNLGRGVISALAKTADMQLVAVFSRRTEELKKVVKDVPVLNSQKIDLPKGLKIDVVVLCGGSRQDTPVQGPYFAGYFNTVDSFDTHADIPAYFSKMEAIDKVKGHVSVISAGWDPGIFSFERVMGEAFLPGSKGYTFWGTGVSQGHSDAARTVAGVLDARSYTLPVESALQQVRGGKEPEFSKRQMHQRKVYVVAKEGADREKIRREIAGMPNYFDEYDVEVVFISRAEMEKNHAAIPHGGFVMTTGVTGQGNTRQILEYRCQLQSNPEFTGSVLVACARAAVKLKAKGESGCYTMLDIPPALFSAHSAEELRSHFM
jgi:diaminopimelate dehydrogenase